MGKPGRQANFELLRIIAMFMVVILHWNTNSGLLLDVGSPVTGAGVWSLVTESVCIVAVNVYVLISGYFLSSCTFSFRRVAQVLFQTLFYTVLIPPVLALVGVLSWSEVLNPYHIWNSIFPVQSGHYWFVSAYVVLCLLSPFSTQGWKPFPKNGCSSCWRRFCSFSASENPSVRCSLRWIVSDMTSDGLQCCT